MYLIDSQLETLLSSADNKMKINYIVFPRNQSSESIYKNQRRVNDRGSFLISWLASLAAMLPNKRTKEEK